MLGSEHSRLESEWQALQSEIENCFQVWRDPTRRVFEEQCWSELQNAVPAYLDTLNNLAETMAYVRQQLVDLG